MGGDRSLSRPDQRRGDLFEALHDGSWFGTWVQGLAMPLTAVAQILLVVSGLYL